MASTMSSRASRGIFHHSCKTFTNYTLFEATVCLLSNVYTTVSAQSDSLNSDEFPIPRKNDRHLSIDR